ncbi:MAG: hypothetical protein ACJ76D_08535 [Solirubrobacterales bacterium]
MRRRLYRKGKRVDLFSHSERKSTWEGTAGHWMAAVMVIAFVISIGRNAQGKVEEELEPEGTV